jgi:flagellar biosynthesis regulator FlaF
METQSGKDFTTACVMDVPTISSSTLPRLEDYFLKSTQKLDTISARVGRNERIDRAAHDWMLSSVDFLVETIGADGLELGDELRSNLLQLLLAIANLNERIRQQALLTD